jgi:hypothetical protein
MADRLDQRGRPERAGDEAHEIGGHDQADGLVAHPFQPAPQADERPVQPVARDEQGDGQVDRPHLFRTPGHV